MLPFKLFLNLSKVDFDQLLNIHKNVYKFLLKNNIQYASVFTVDYNASSSTIFEFVNSKKDFIFDLSKRTTHLVVFDDPNPNNIFYFVDLSLTDERFLKKDILSQIQNYRLLK